MTVREDGFYCGVYRLISGFIVFIARSSFASLKMGIPYEWTRDGSDMAVMHVNPVQESTRTLQLQQLPAKI